MTTLTAAGGHAHTAESRAKIGNANRGKVPWNRGRRHSEETRAKIRATTMRNHRLKREAHAATLGLTLEELEAQEAEAKTARSSRKSLPPSEETRKKISEGLKAKWANPEYREHMSAQLKGRTGTHHTEEAKKRISDSLKKKWNDPEYRDNIVAHIRNNKVQTQGAAFLLPLVTKMRRVFNGYLFSPF